MIKNKNNSFKKAEKSDKIYHDENYNVKSKNNAKEENCTNDLQNKRINQNKKFDYKESNDYIEDSAESFVNLYNTEDFKMTTVNKKNNSCKKAEKSNLDNKVYHRIISEDKYYTEKIKIKNFKTEKYKKESKFMTKEIMKDKKKL